MKFLFALICTVFFLTPLSGQQIEKFKGRHMYILNDTIRIYQQMGDVFKRAYPSYVSYSKSLKANRWANGVGLPTIVTASLVTLAPKVIETDEAFFFALASWLTYIPAMGTAAIGCKVLAMIHRRRAISLFNQSTEISGVSSALSWDLDLGQTQHGIGLTITF